MRKNSMEHGSRALVSPVLFAPYMETNLSRFLFFRDKYPIMDIFRSLLILEEINDRRICRYLSRSKNVEKTICTKGSSMERNKNVFARRVR